MVGRTRGRGISFTFCAFKVDCGRCPQDKKVEDGRARRGAKVHGTTGWKGKAATILYG